MARLSPSSVKFAARINAHINKSTLYTSGTVISYKKLTSHTKHLFPNLVGRNPAVTADTYAFIRAYTILNKFLAHRGLQLRSKKLKHFEVTSASQSLNKVTKLRKKASGCVTAAVNLEVGVRTHGAVWSPLAQKEVESVARHVFTPIVSSGYGA